MAARSRRVRLSNDVEIQTPLLVPGLSSRALNPVDFESEPRRPETTPCSVVHSLTLIDGIDEALLLSAYDIRYELLAETSAFYEGFARSRYANQRFLIIDSGWYEKGGGPPGGVFFEGLDAPALWEESDYHEILEQLDPDVTAAVVNWDTVGPYPEQIAQAQQFFGGRSRYASIILLKRPGDVRFHRLEQLSGSDFANLRAFDIVGVTEKELGETLIQRLVNLAKLRINLDEQDVQAPIQVFGGLDPLYTPLYFAAGAEIFDGLSWLRYAFRNGVSVSRETAAILDGQVNKRWMPTLQAVSLQNLDAMRILSDEMLVFYHNNDDWSKISATGDLLRSVYERFHGQLSGQVGGRHGR